MRVALDHWSDGNQFLWHGMIMPQTNQELLSWFKKYTDYISTWASIAEQEDVDVFVIGSEMNALSATKSITVLPEQIEYFSNKTKQLNEKDRLLEHKALIGLEDLSLPGNKKHANLNNYLDDLSLIHI